MRILMLAQLFLGAHLNLTALVPLQPGHTPPPWWVGGRLAWPFAVNARTLIPPGDLLNSLTPILGITAAICLLSAAGALLGWIVPPHWFAWLVGVGVAASLVLQIVWISPWALLPLLIDIALAGMVFGLGLNVARLRG